jgi:hypothetical protein
VKYLKKQLFYKKYMSEKPFMCVRRGTNIAGSVPVLFLLVILLASYKAACHAKKHQSVE